MTELHWHNHLKYILQELHWIFVWICFIVYAQMNLKMASVTAYNSFLLMKD